MCRLNCTLQVQRIETHRFTETWLGIPKRFPFAPSVWNLGFSEVESNNQTWMPSKFETNKA